MNPLAPQQRALLCCARVQLDEDSRRELSALLRAGLDLHALAQSARWHGLSAMVCRHVQDVAGSEASASAGLAQLRADTQSDVVKSLALASELVEVLHALRGAGVHALAVKGP